MSVAQGCCSFPYNFSVVDQEHCASLCPSTTFPTMDWSCSAHPPVTAFAPVKPLRAVSECDVTHAGSATNHTLALSPATPVWDSHFFIRHMKPPPGFPMARSISSSHVSLEASPVTEFLVPLCPYK